VCHAGGQEWKLNDLEYLSMTYDVVILHNFYLKHFAKMKIRVRLGFKIK
jgi:hypothetical protein